MTREQIIEILKNRECFNKYGQNYVYEFDYDLVAEDILSLTQQEEPSVSAEDARKKLNKALNYLNGLSIYEYVGEEAYYDLHDLIKDILPNPPKTEK